MSASRDNAGRFQPGQSGNRKGRPKKDSSVDAAVLEAAQEKVSVSNQGRRKRKTKLAVSMVQTANMSATGDLAATRLLLSETRKAEERAEARASRAPVMTEADHEIAARVIARLRHFIQTENSDDQP